MNGTEITLYDKIDDPLAAVERLGRVFAKSGMFGCEKEEQGQLLALACMATKKDPFQFLDENHLINGRRSMRADRMLANYRARGGKVTWKQFDDKAAVGLWTFEQYKDFEIAYTIEDAKRADLIRPKSGWEKDPGAMLRARCISKAVRMVCPEAIAGAYLPDEKAIDIEATVQPQEQPKAELFKSNVAETAAAATDQKPVVATVDAEIVNDTAQGPIFCAKCGKPSTGINHQCDPLDHAAQNTGTPRPEPPKVAGDYMDFMKLIKGHEEAVFNWAVKNQKIRADQKLSDMPTGLMRKACEKPEKFLSTVGVKK
jgi:hypothetical protein